MASALQLKPDETYSLQVNSMPNCDECEVYADEFREFLNGIPGWKVSGGVVVFSLPRQRGLKLIVGPDEDQSPMTSKLLTAFSLAVIKVNKEIEQQAQKGFGVLLVARRD